MTFPKHSGFIFPKRFQVSHDCMKPALKKSHSVFDKCYEMTYLSSNLLHCNFLQVCIFQEFLDCLLQLVISWWFFKHLDQRLIIIGAITFIWKKKYSMSNSALCKTEAYSCSFDFLNDSMQCYVRQVKKKKIIISDFNFWSCIRKNFLHYYPCSCLLSFSFGCCCCQLSWF